MKYCSLCKSSELYFSHVCHVKSKTLPSLGKSPGYTQYPIPLPSFIASPVLLYPLYLFSTTVVQIWWSTSVWTRFWGSISITRDRVLEPVPKHFSVQRGNWLKVRWKKNECKIDVSKSRLEQTQYEIQEPPPPRTCGLLINRGPYRISYEHHAIFRYRNFRTDRTCFAACAAQTYCMSYGHVQTAGGGGVSCTHRWWVWKNGVPKSHCESTFREKMEGKTRSLCVNFALAICERAFAPSILNCGFRFFLLNCQLKKKQ